MRSTTLVMIAALVLGACGEDRSDPAGLDQLDTFTADFSSVAYGIDGVVPGAALHELWRLERLPEPIKLTAEQEATITKLLDDYQKAHEADLKELTKLLDDARKAIQAGKTRAEVAAILQQARAVQLRLREATAKLKTDIDAVLTTEQQAWLASGSPARCYPTIVAPLSAEQRTTIKALNAAFVAATEADRAVARAALDAAAKARQQGKSREEIRAILEPARDEMQRLQEAASQLRADIWAVLTPAQRDSGCFGPAPRTGT